MPTRTLTYKRKQCKNWHNSKVHLTRLLYVNSDGSENMTSLMIGKKRPRWLKKLLTLKYDASKNASITAQNFTKGREKHLDKLTKLQKRNVSLVQDCKAHPVDF